GCDREALEMPLDVREPQENELHTFLLQSLEHVLARLLARRRTVLRLDLRHCFLLGKHEEPRDAQGARPRLRRLTSTGEFTLVPEIGSEGSGGRRRAADRPQRGAVPRGEREGED